MKYLLDTDHCIAIVKKNPAILEALRAHPPSRVRVSSISVGELYFGAAKSRHPDDARTNVQRLLKTLAPVLFDESAAAAYGEVRAILERKGSPIGPLDTLIASHALALGWILVTHNTREFKRIKGLTVEDWLPASP